MQICLFVLVFCSLLGLLCAAYFHHFRYRAMVMGPERLLNSLSRAVTGEEGAADEELWGGLLELERRLRLAAGVDCLAIAVILAADLALTVLSSLPELALALSGIVILLVCLLVSLLMLRDILRLIRSHLEKIRGKAGG